MLKHSNSQMLQIKKYGILLAEMVITIITFDSGFIEIATLRGTPPKIVWLRFDNSPNLKIANKLLLNAEAIKGFINDTDSGIGLLEID